MRPPIQGRLSDRLLSPPYTRLIILGLLLIVPGNAINHPQQNLPPEPSNFTRLSLKIIHLTRDRRPIEPESDPKHVVNGARPYLTQNPLENLIDRLDETTLEALSFRDGGQQTKTLLHPSI